MSPALESLSRQLAASPRWRWLPGMMWIRLPSGAPDDGGDCGRLERPSDAIPDLSDPATWGSLLAQLPPSLDIAADAVGVSILMFTGAGNVTVTGDTWGEAVARAWLATRGR